MPLRYDPMPVDFDDLDERCHVPQRRSVMTPITKPFHIAGVQFQDLTGFPRTLPEQTPARLRHNPRNKFDPFAVEVRVSDYLVGHIPRQELAMLHHLARQGVKVGCLITRYDAHEPPYRQFLAVLVAPDGTKVEVEEVKLS